LPSTYTLIKGETLASSAASYTFTAIPSTFTDLVLRVSARSDNAQQVVSLILKVNTDTATNYSRVFVFADSSNTASSAINSNATTIGMAGGVNGSTSTANTFSNFEMYVPNYLSSTNKPMSAVTAPESNSATLDNGHNQNFASLWRNTAAITDLTLTTNGSFVTGSSFYLYGIKNS